MTDTSVAQAIDESVMRDRIVTIEGDVGVTNELFLLCDDSAQMTYDRTDGSPGRLVEFWGRDDDGNAWRVHVEVEPASEEVQP